MPHDLRVHRKSRPSLKRSENTLRKRILLAVCVIGVAVLLLVNHLMGKELLKSEKGSVEAFPKGGFSHMGPEKPIATCVSPWDERREKKISELARRPNELGTVPIIMYHAIGEPESDWVRTPDNFRADLMRFYELGYSLVPFQSYLSGQMDLKAGVSPLIITFDDSSAGQFRFVTKKYVSEDGARIPLELKVPDPNSAVGILLEFSGKHPGFGHAATFYLNFPAPFGSPDEKADKLRYLLECGMEIGNHTYNHKDLLDCPKDVIMAELGKQSNEVERLTGVKPLSLALPYGNYPRDGANKQYLLQGQYEGVSYRNLGVLLVGAEPALSPYHQSLNKAALPRIRGSEEELSKWLRYLDDSGTRYVSDGSLATIAVPESRKDDVSETFGDGFEIVIVPNLP